jgi:hypothetical protein
MIGYGNSMFLNRFDSTGITPPPALLLDTYPNAAVAYSLRKLRSDYKKVDNLLTYSEDISQTTYQKSNLVATGTPPYIDVTTAPNGTLTADKLIEDTSFNLHFLTQQFSPLSVGLDYNFSVYLKAGERTKVSIQISGGSVRVNLLTGVIETNTTTSTPIVTNVGNGWWRFSILNIPAATLANPLYRIFIVNALDSTSYVGDGVSGVYVWGFQLTQSSTVQPYEKTVVAPSNGSAIRVRRSSDNAEQDINFVGGDLDTTSLLTFCGAGNGFITTWYDQSTNANNATQATAATQAQIVSSGALILDADTSKITSTWTADRYALTTGISSNTKYLSISMFRRGATTSDILTHLGNSTSTTLSPLLWLGAGTSYSIRSYMPTLLAFQNLSTTGRCIITSLKDAANLKVGYRNGVQLTTTATEAPTAGTLNTFGQVSTTNFTSGQYQEYIYWNSEQSANRTAIETDINTYWNAY